MVESVACMLQNLLLKLIQSLFLINDDKSVACMPQNLLLKLIQSLFWIDDGKSAAFVPQNSSCVMDGHQTTDRPSNPDLLRSQMGYIILDSDV
jgi:hypothetical protein